MHKFFDDVGNALVFTGDGIIVNADIVFVDVNEVLSTGAGATVAAVDSVRGVVLTSPFTASLIAEIVVS